jgi:hypothetical protein
MTMFYQIIVVVYFSTVTTKRQSLWQYPRLAAMPYKIPRSLGPCTLYLPSAVQGTY